MYHNTKYLVYLIFIYHDVYGNPRFFATASVFEQGHSFY